MGPMRGRFAPLAVRPFGRLLSSYTLNELGDSVGLVALAVLVYDRTQAVAPTAAFFFAAKFLPALVAPPLTARFDQAALRKSLPLLYLAEALAFAALALLAETTFVLGLVLALGLLDGALAITARGLTRGAVATVLQPKGLLKEGNALMNMGFAFSAVGGAALVLFTLVIPIEVIYAKESLGTSDAGFGILLASWGAGIMVGSLVYLLIKNRSTIPLIIGATAAIGAAYLGLATAETLLVACLVSIVGGAGNGVQWIAVMTALQEATPSDYQARIVGLLESLAAAMPGVGYLLGGALVAIGSPRTAYAFAGAGVLLLVLGGIALRPRLEQHPAARRRASDLPVVAER